VLAETKAHAMAFGTARTPKHCQRYRRPSGRGFAGARRCLTPGAAMAGPLPVCMEGVS
jgi:hypothetical protein